MTCYPPLPKPPFLFPFLSLDFFFFIFSSIFGHLSFSVTSAALVCHPTMTNTPLNPGHQSIITKESNLMENEQIEDFVKRQALQLYPLLSDIGDQHPQHIEAPRANNCLTQSLVIIKPLPFGLDNRKEKISHLKSPLEQDFFKCGHFQGKQRSSLEQ